MKLRFQVDADRLTLNDLIAIEEENQSPKFIRDFLARFVVDGKGNYLEPEEAQEMVGNMTLGEMIKAVNDFGDAVQELQATAIPKVNG